MPSGWTVYEQTLVVNTASNNNQENHQPIAHIITIFPSSATYGQPINFQGYGQDGEDGSTSTFYWSSNIDGQIGSSSSFYKSDLSIGSHTITFKVRDSDGMWSEPVTRTLTILANNSNPENIAPVADTGGPYSGFVNENVSFSGLGSSDSDGTIKLYKWTFGDGTAGVNSTTSHIYSNPGTYFVSLTVTDNNGNTSADTTTVTVQPQEENNDNTSNDNTNDKWVIPGFEAILVFITISIIIVIKKTKKKK
jgi:PKD repeat protein